MKFIPGAGAGFVTVPMTKAPWDAQSALPAPRKVV